MPAPPEVPAEVAEAMSPALVHPGTWVMTRRDTQITWLIRFSAAWKQLPRGEQEALAADPWKLKDFTGQVDAPSAGSAQKRCQHAPISPPEPRFRVHPAQHCDLLAADQYFGVLRRRRSGQQRQPGQHRDTEPGDQANLHDVPSSQVGADGRVSDVLQAEHHGCRRTRRSVTYAA
jgi:hypothetical protein